MSPNFAAVAQWGIGAFALYILYLILKMFQPLIMARLEPRQVNYSESNGVRTQVAVLESKVETLRTTVVPISEVVGDVRVLLDAIADLRKRVTSLEEDRRV